MGLEFWRSVSYLETQPLIYKQKFLDVLGNGRVLRKFKVAPAISSLPLPGIPPLKKPAQIRSKQYGLQGLDEAENPKPQKTSWTKGSYVSNLQQSNMDCCKTSYFLRILEDVPINTAIFISSNDFPMFDFQNVRPFSCFVPGNLVEFASTSRGSLAQSICHVEVRNR